MLHDSMDVGVLAENVRLLQKEIKEAGSELPTPAAGDTGKILKVGSDGYELATEYSYTPPAYLFTETATGIKWVDGKDIYMKSFSGNTPSSSGTFNFGNVGPIETLVHLFGSIYGEGATSAHLFERATDTIVYFTSGDVNANFTSGSPYFNGKYNLTVLYTKPDPEPANETKKTKKK